MKKNYIAPEVKVTKVALQNMIAMSLDPKPYNGEPVLGKEELDEDLSDILDGWNL